MKERCALHSAEESMIRPFGRWLLVTVLSLTLSIPSLWASSSPEDSSYVYHHMLFYEGSRVFIDLNYRYVMEELIDHMKKNPSLYLHIRGHVCCGPGMKISARRAKNVYRFLKRSGITKERITYRGYSNEIPLSFSEKSEEDAARNRRVDFILSQERRTECFEVDSARN